MGKIFLFPAFLSRNSAFPAERRIPRRRFLLCSQSPRVAPLFTPPLLTAVDSALNASGSRRLQRRQHVRARREDRPAVHISDTRRARCHRLDSSSVSPAPSRANARHPAPPPHLASYPSSRANCARPSTPSPTRHARFRLAPIAIAFVAFKAPYRDSFLPCGFAVTPQTSTFFPNAGHLLKSPSRRKASMSPFSDSPSPTTPLPI